jgi:hypothetical protein
MNRLRESFLSTLSGFDMFVAEYKYFALVICCVVYVFMNWKRYKKTKSETFFVFCVLMIAMIIFPVTGMALQIYQTKFYDYPWVWSCVPMAAMIAWGSVAFIFEEIPRRIQKEEGKSTKGQLFWKNLCGIAVIVAILFMCGNQGRLNALDEKTVQDEMAAEQILEYLETNNLLVDHVVWGKAGVLQYLRSHNGQVVLLYGRDMWEAKAGAYDYEGYTKEEIACYEWMEILSSAHNLYLLEVEQPTKEIVQALSTEEHIKAARSMGADIVILPTKMIVWMEKYIQLPESEGAIVSKEIGEYTVWEFK